MKTAYVQNADTKNNLSFHAVMLTCRKATTSDKRQVYPEWLLSTIYKAAAIMLSWSSHYVNMKYYIAKPQVA
jgi:hypothetical protein